jgi:hypothetical protein
LAIVEKDLHDAIGAKPARGRVHPVAVVTASSRMSRNSRARWPPVLQPTGAPCEGCPMFIHPDDRPRSSDGAPKLVKWGLPGRGSNLLKSRRLLTSRISGCPGECDHSVAQAATDCSQSAP